MPSSIGNLIGLRLRFLLLLHVRVGKWGQGADLLENRGWDGLSDRVIEVAYSASRSFLTASS